MTADSVQNTYIAKTQKIGTDKDSGKAASLFGARDLFGLFRKSDPSENAQISSQRALLKDAYKMLEQAERDLHKKDEKIQELRQILTIDELTKLTNRRGFYQAFKAELDRTNRGENAGGLLIMIDLDDFKIINDTFGHQAGDEALRTVGTYLKKTFRSMDIPARLGGDEFIILMPNTSINLAIERAQSLGKELNKLSYDWKGAHIKIRGSLGLKEYKRGDTIESIIAHADKGLYANKEQRRQTRH